MELNRKILLWGLFIIIIALIIAIGFALSIKLDRPVFFKNYLEYDIPINEGQYGNQYFTIQYITNISDNSRILNVYFKEDPHICFYAQEHDSNEIYGRYSIHTVKLELCGNDIGKGFDQKELSNAKVIFNDNKEMDVNLGRIILYSEAYEDDGYFDFISGSDSSDGSSSSIVKVKKDIKLVDLRSPLLEKADSLVNIKIDDKEYKSISGVEYQKNDIFRISTKVDMPKDILDEYNYLDIMPKIYFKDSNGNILSFRMYNIRYTPYSFSFKKISDYLKARGEI